MTRIKVVGVCRNYDDSKGCVKCDEPEPCDIENCVDCNDNCMDKHEAQEIHCPRYEYLKADCA
jgi:hypothetical protein